VRLREALKSTGFVHLLIDDGRCTTDGNPCYGDWFINDNNFFNKKDSTARHQFEIGIRTALSDRWEPFTPDWTLCPYHPTYKSPKVIQFPVAGGHDG
jgi:hypothetical protein